MNDSLGDTIKTWLKRLGLYVVWFFVSYGLILAASPIVLSFTRGNGLLTFACFSLIGLGMSVVAPYVSEAGRLFLIKRGLIVDKDYELAAAVEALERGSVTQAIGEIGGYEILGLLDQRDWWTSYLARRPNSLNTFALKLPSASARNDKTVWRLLQSEAKVLAAIKDVRGTPDIASSDKLPDGCPYLVLKPTRSRALSDLADELKAPQVLAAFRTLAKIAANVHAQGYTHRMISTESVRIDDFGRIQLTQFCYAVTLSDRNPLATRESPLDTQSPEQLETARSVDQSSDIYSLGAVLYRLLTGQSPHGEGTAHEVMERIRNGVINDEFAEATPILIEKRHPDMDLDLVNQLADICLKCLERDPAHRFPSARRIVELFDKFRVGADRRFDMPESGSYATQPSFDTGASRAPLRTVNPRSSGARAAAPRSGSGAGHRSVSLQQLQSASPFIDNEDSDTMDLQSLAASIRGPNKAPSSSKPSPMKPASPKRTSRPAAPIRPKDLPPPPPKIPAGFSLASSEEGDIPPLDSQEGSIATLFGESLEEDNEPPKRRR